MEQAPPPDTEAGFNHLSEVEIERHYSPLKHHRVIVSRDPAGCYRIHCQRWDTSDWEIASAAYWHPQDRFATITDTVEIARKLATEYLASVERSERAYDV
jgi:hypothetical protein